MKTKSVSILFFIILIIVLGSCVKGEEIQPTCQPSDEFGATRGLEIVKHHFLIEEGVAEDSSSKNIINIFYPQVTGLEDSNIECEVNRKLLFFLTIDPPYIDSDFFEQQVLNQIEFEIQGSYEVLHFCKNLLSVKYDEKISTNRVTINTHFLTIDLETGAEMSLFDIIDKSIVLEKIVTGEYTIVEGTYLPGGWSGHEDYIREDFCDILKNDVITFGIIKEGIYIYFDYEDSLNGYVILFIEDKGTVLLS